MKINVMKQRAAKLFLISGIVISSSVAAETGSILCNKQIDRLFNWAETEYPHYFPKHTESRDILDYYAREYSSIGSYLGVKDGHLFVYGDQFENLITPGKLQDLGEIELWIRDKGL